MSKTVHNLIRSHLSVILCIPVLVCFFAAGAAYENSDASSDIDLKTRDLMQILDQTLKLPIPQPQTLQGQLDQAFLQLIDFTRLSENIIGKNRERFSIREQIQIVDAVEVSIKQDIQSWYEAVLAKGALTKTWIKEEKQTDRSQISYRLQWDEENHRIEVYVEKKSASGWMVVDLKIDRSKLSDTYRKRIHNLLKNYDFPGMIAELKRSDFLFIDDFSQNENGVIPRGWIWKKKDDKKEKLIEVREADGNKYINLRDRGATVIYAKAFKWDLNAFPYLSWKWRIHAVPEGGDERFNETNDSAAAVYIVFSKNLAGVPKSVKYVWSTTLPVGVATRRTGIGRPWSIVAKSGEQGLGEWHTEVFDLRKAFRDTFGDNPPDNALGIAILTDANSTDSYSEADYDDFKLFRQASADSGVKQFLKGGK